MKIRSKIIIVTALLFVIGCKQTSSQQQEEQGKNLKQADLKD